MRLSKSVTPSPFAVDCELSLEPWQMEALRIVGLKYGMSNGALMRGALTFFLTWVGMTEMMPVSMHQAAVVRPVAEAEDK